MNWRAASAYGAVPSPLRHWIADTLVPSLPARLGRMAQRSFLAMPRTPEAMFFDNFAGIGLKRQAALLSPAHAANATATAPMDPREATSTGRTGPARRSTGCSIPT